MRFHLRHNLFNQLEDVTGNCLIELKWRIRESSCSAMKNLCVVVLLCSKYGRIGILSCFISNIWVLFCMESNLKFLGKERKFNKLLEVDDEFLLLRGLFCSSSCGLSVLLCLFVKCYRIFTSTDSSEMHGEVGAEVKNSSISFQTRSSILIFYSTYAQLNFSTGTTSQYDVRVRQAEAVITVVNFVLFPCYVQTCRQIWIGDLFWLDPFSWNRGIHS